MGTVLLVTGLLTTAIGAWRGYAAARLALAPLVHDGDATRSLVEARRPVLARTRVRRFARRLGSAILWLLVASYGLFMVSVASVAR